LKIQSLKLKNNHGFTLLKKIKKNSLTGFTLIETLISVAIIGIICAFSIPNLYRAIENNSVRLETQRLVSFLRNAQARTLAGRNAEGGGFAGYAVKVYKDSEKYELINRKDNSLIDFVKIEKNYIDIEEDAIINFEPLRRGFTTTVNYIHIQNDYSFKRCVYLKGPAGLIEMTKCP